ncbi:MAG: PQQ-dependent sugar dehydrogenase, partial [Balneolaceae bacterium]
MRLTKRIVLFLNLSLLGFACSAPEEEKVYFPLPQEDLEIVHSEVQSFMVDTVVTDLERPWGMEFLPDNRVLITERAGNLLIVEDGQVKENPVQGNIPESLRHVELHPDYDENGWIYLSYYIEPDPEGEDVGYTALMRGRLEGDRLVDDEFLFKAGPFDEEPRRLRVGHSTGSRIAFDEEGYLYFAVGIRGGRMNAQDTTRYSGKTLRLNDDGTIPSDNPFVDTEGALNEIFTYGQREHQGLIRHPETGEMWSVEHGQKGGDELNILRPGLNYGWPLASYSTEYSGEILTEDTLRAGMEPPIHHWTPSISPSGLDVVLGDRYPGWTGDLFVGSLSQRMLNRSDLNDHRVVRDEK